MRHVTFSFGFLLIAGSALAARVYSKRERVQLSAARATAFNTVITGQLPTCTNWRQGFFTKECSGGGQLAPAGTCPGPQTVVTVLYPDCRYTPSTVADLPDGFQLETE